METSALNRLQSQLLILGLDGEPVGSGFICSEGHVMTCAHVVSQAISGDHSHAGLAEPPDAAITVRFARGGLKAAARVAARGWFPRGGGKIEDIAVLAIEDGEPIPSGVRAAVMASDVPEDDERLYGLGIHPQYRDGVNLVAHFVGYAAGPTDRYAVHSFNADQTVQPGCSGAAMFSSQGAVAGMVVERQQNQTGLLIPSAVLRKAWPMAQCAIGSGEAFARAGEARDGLHHEASHGATALRGAAFDEEGEPDDEVPFQAPIPPSSFIDRPEITGELKAILLDAGEKQALVVSAIQGLGGIGKTALASFIAHDPAIQNRFKDGILWATLGQEPDLQQWLNNWIQALGDFDFKSNNPDIASRHLQTLLRNRRTLMIVDDVWSEADARFFLVGGRNCRIILTTRLRDIAQDVGAHLYEIGLLSEGQAIALIEARLRRELAGDERHSAREMVKAVGYLPLAVGLVAAQIGRGIPWAELIAAFREEIVRIEALDTPRHRRAGESKLLACFNLSLDRLRRQDEGAWRTFIMLGILPEDTPFDAEVVANSQGISRQDADDILGLLYDDALVMRSAASRTKRGGPMQTYRLHDLLYDISRKLLVSAPPAGLGLSLLESHRRLIANYQGLLRDGRWSSLPDDGYIRRRLFRHLIDAGLHATMQAVLDEEDEDGANAWFTSNDQLGLASGFAEDVELALNDILGSLETASSFGPEAATVLKLVLSLASINSVVSNSPPELMMARVKSGIWLPEQALAYARLTSVRTRRLEAFAFLMPLQEPASASEISKVLCDELIADTSITAEEVCGFLARDLPANISARVHDRLLASSRFHGIGRLRAEAIFNLAPFMSERQRLGLAQEALGWPGRLERLIALIGLLPFLSENAQRIEESIASDIDALPPSAGWARTYIEACMLGMRHRRGDEVEDRGALLQFLRRVPEEYSTKKMLVGKLVWAARPEALSILLEYFGTPDESFVRNLAKRLSRFGKGAVDALVSALGSPYLRSTVTAIAALESRDADETSAWIDESLDQTRTLGDVDGFNLNALALYFRGSGRPLINSDYEADEIFHRIDGHFLELATLAALTFCPEEVFGMSRERFFSGLLTRVSNIGGSLGLVATTSFSGISYLRRLSRNYTIENIGDLFGQDRKSDRELGPADRAFIIVTKAVEAGLVDRGWWEFLPWCDEEKFPVDTMLFAAMGLQDKPFTLEDLFAFGGRIIERHCYVPSPISEIIPSNRVTEASVDRILKDIVQAGHKTTRDRVMLLIFLLQCVIPDDETESLERVGSVLRKVGSWWPAA